MWAGRDIGGFAGDWYRALDDQPWARRARARETLEAGRVRRPGAGRKPLAETDPTLLADLERLIDPEARGDPELVLRWTAKSLHTLARELREMGHEISARSVAPLLRELGYSLQSNRKAKEGKQHPDRDAQFRHINKRVSAAIAAGEPAISIDTSCRRRHEVSNADLVVMPISV